MTDIKLGINIKKKRTAILRETVIDVNILKNMPSFRREKIRENNGISTIRSIIQVKRVVERYSSRDILILLFLRSSFRSEKKWRLGSKILPRCLIAIFV